MKDSVYKIANIVSSNNQKRVYLYNPKNPTETETVFVKKDKSKMCGIDEIVSYLRLLGYKIDINMEVKHK